MISLGFCLDDLLRSRFAVSAVGEVVEAVHAIQDPVADGGYGEWLGRQGKGFGGGARDHDVRPLFALVPSCSYVPDFLMPLPRSSAGDLEAELAVVRATPAVRAAAEIGRCLRRRGPVERDVARQLR